ncbi:MAG: integrase catalytic domain-containing protein, partial [Bacteroidaceae bacterium]|nr:integrase catalytic domain-containing protein [Bacteroidaceae bacterium]
RSIGERIKDIKALMRRAQEEGYHQNTAYLSFSNLAQEVDNVYLNESELDAIYDLQFDEKTEHLQKYRDLFLVGCYTGLRWEDFKSIKKEDFSTSPKGYPILIVRTAKTGTRTVIPFLWSHLKDILERYNYTMPKVSEQKFNKYVKEVCHLAGVNTPVIITSGKHARNEPYEKWELVSAHTARRSACTNMFLKGIPTIAIMKISAHRKEATFLKYIKVSDEENADFVAENYAESD